MKRYRVMNSRRPLKVGSGRPRWLVPFEHGERRRPLKVGSGREVGYLFTPSRKVAVPSRSGRDAFKWKGASMTSIVAVPSRSGRDRSECGPLLDRLSVAVPSRSGRNEQARSIRAGKMQAVAVPSRSGRNRLIGGLAIPALYPSPSPQGRVGTRRPAPARPTYFTMSPSPQGRVGTGVGAGLSPISLTSPSPQGRVGTKLSIRRKSYGRKGRRPLKVGSGRTTL